MSPPPGRSSATLRQAPARHRTAAPVRNNRRLHQPAASHCFAENRYLRATSQPPFATKQPASFAASERHFLHFHLLSFYVFMLADARERYAYRYMRCHSCAAADTPDRCERHRLPLRHASHAARLQ